MQIEIGGKAVGDDCPCYVIAEIGINHNGSLDVARRLIDAAADAGCDAVKFQKRDINMVYSQEELDAPRESPWGTTNRQQKEGLELGWREYDAINEYCRMAKASSTFRKRMDAGIFEPTELDDRLHWFASCWDVWSVQNMSQHERPAYKIASASITDRELLNATCQTGKPILLSTGMSTLVEIDAAVAYVRSRGNPLVVMHCTSTYPSKSEELNLRCIPALRERYKCLVGYSGHEVGLQTTLAAVALGACVVERHITLDRTMYGSDQAASIEPHGFAQLVRDIREIEKALGDGVKRVYDSELPIRKKLRKVETTVTKDELIEYTREAIDVTTWDSAPFGQQKFSPGEWTRVKRTEG